MKKLISLSDVIANRVRDKNGWRNMRRAEREKALTQIKDVLLRGTRAGSQTNSAINRMSINNLPGNIGLYGRVMTDEYVAGQDYPGELRYIRARIAREC